jgi:hypothetical protein
MGISVCVGSFTQVFRVFLSFSSKFETTLHDKYANTRFIHFFISNTLNFILEVRGSNVYRNILNEALRGFPQDL